MSLLLEIPKGRLEELINPLILKCVCEDPLQCKASHLKEAPSKPSHVPIKVSKKVCVGVYLKTQVLMPLASWDHKSIGPSPN